jgi:formylglycine-generating enzyme required for sulfatase activity
MDTNPSHFKGDDLPVENVSWWNVQNFISKLNSETGKNYRLPTEEEWEYAARGGNESKKYKFSGSDSIDEVAWYEYNSGNQTHKVGEKKANEKGIYDLTGNVWEWCSTSLDKKYRGDEGYRIARGGCFICSARNSYNAFRSYYEPRTCSETLGFRLVCDTK